MGGVVEVVGDCGETETLSPKPIPVKPDHQIIILATRSLVILVPTVHRNEIFPEHRQVPAPGPAALPVEESMHRSGQDPGSEVNSVVGFGGLPPEPGEANSEWPKC